MISKIKLKNFTCFEDKTFEFKRFNVIVGKNGTGKSSILDSILYVLTNRSFRIRRYIEELIQTNKNEMSVSVQIGNYEITRSRKRGLERKLDLMLPRDKKEIKKRAQEIHDMYYTTFEVKDLQTNQLLEIHNQLDLRNFISSILNVNPEFIDYTKIIKFAYFRPEHLIKFHPLDLIEDLFLDLEKLKEKIHNLIDEYNASLDNLNNKLFHFQEILKLFPEKSQSEYLKDKTELKQKFDELINLKENLMKKIVEFSTLLNLTNNLIENKTCPVCQTIFSETSFFNDKIDYYKNNIEDFRKNIDIVSNEISNINQLLVEIEKKLSLFENLPNKNELEQLIKDLQLETNRLSDKIKILKILDKNFPRLKTEIFSQFLTENENLILKLFYELFEEIASVKVVPASEFLLYLIKNNNQVEYQNLATSEKVKINLIITFLIILTYWNLSVPFLFYDEIFDHLDKFNFQKVLTFFVFNRLFKDLQVQQKQIFLITHRIEDIKEISEYPDINIILLDR